MGDEDHKVGVGGGVGAAASADVQVFRSVQSTVTCMQEILEHSMQSFMLSFSARYFHWVFKDGAMGVKVPVAVQERRSVHALLSRESTPQECTCTPF